MNIRVLVLATALLLSTGAAWAQAAPGPVEIDGRFEVEGVDRQDKAGLLMTPAVRDSFDALKQSIKGR